MTPLQAWTWVALALVAASTIGLVIRLATILRRRWRQDREWTSAGDVLLGGGR